VPSGGRAVIASRLLPALERLSNALVASATLDELLRQILEIFLDAVNADVAVLRLVEDRSLRSRAALGLEEEVAAGHSLPIGDDLPTEPVARPPDGEFMKRKGVRGLYLVPLVRDGKVVAIVYLGTLSERAFGDADR